MTRLISPAVAVAALLMAVSPATAQDTPPAPQQAMPETTLSDVVVEGMLVERTRRFVDEISRAPGRRPLARWNGPLCVGVANMRADAAQVLIDRVAVVGNVLGVRSGEPGCRPNVMVVAAHTADADALVLDATRNINAFRPSTGGTDLGGAALQRFRDSDAPVRWWHVALPVVNETGEVAIALWPDGAPQVNISRSSRIGSSIRHDLARVVIVIDVDKAGAASFGALTDYVALLALAQIDPTAEVSEADTIMNLFSTSSTAPDRLTEWDANFLVSLYASRPDVANGWHQETELARRMARSLRSGG
ncbi:hypothetical protein [Brevundimonas sp. GCM10030266]|uniref:hypothetical protein n=1 Tax=Brevundimonas sp. GCM10030266 TaxID=3273386 RepID=UPI00361AFA93